MIDDKRHRAFVTNRTRFAARSHPDRPWRCYRGPYRPRRTGLVRVCYFGSILRKGFRHTTYVGAAAGTRPNPNPRAAHPKQRECEVRGFRGGKAQPVNMAGDGLMARPDLSTA